MINESGAGFTGEMRGQVDQTRSTVKANGNGQVILNTNYNTIPRCNALHSAQSE